MFQAQRDSEVQNDDNFVETNLLYFCQICKDIAFAHTV
jgi:hypothetical protein